MKTKTTCEEQVEELSQIIETFTAEMEKAMIQLEKDLEGLSVIISRIRYTQSEIINTINLCKLL